MESEAASASATEGVAQMADTTASVARENKFPDFEPPQACVQRIIKAALPDNCQITKESKAAFSTAAGIFMIYLTTW